MIICAQFAIICFSARFTIFLWGELWLSNDENLSWMWQTVYIFTFLLRPSLGEKWPIHYRRLSHKTVQICRIMASNRSAGALTHVLKTLGEFSSPLISARHFKKREIIYRAHQSNSTKGVVVNNVHTIFRAAFTEECHLSKPLLILISSFFLSFVRGLTPFVRQFCTTVRFAGPTDQFPSFIFSQLLPRYWWGYKNTRLLNDKPYMLITASVMETIRRPT